MKEAVKEVWKGQWQSPLAITYSEGYAPNEADCFYAADRNFRRWLRTNVNHLMIGWDESLHDKPGFLNFCKWAQLQFLDHMKGMAMTVMDSEFIKAIKEFHEDESRDTQEYEDNDNRTIDWGDESGQTEGCPHLMFDMYSEFRKPDYPEQWFMLVFVNREQSSDDSASWFAPERLGPQWAHDRRRNYCHRDMRALGRHMLKEVKATEEELRKFWAEYETLYPLSDEPEKWHG